jgi:hypothetical protein
VQALFCAHASLSKCELVIVPYHPAAHWLLPTLNRLTDRDTVTTAVEVQPPVGRPDWWAKDWSKSGTGGAVAGLNALSTDSGGAHRANPQDLDRSTIEPNIKASERPHIKAKATIVLRRYDDLVQPATARQLTEIDVGLSYIPA